MTNPSDPASGFEQVIGGVFAADRASIQAERATAATTAPCPGAPTPSCGVPVHSGTATRKLFCNSKSVCPLTRVRTP